MSEKDLFIKNRDKSILIYQQKRGCENSLPQANHYQTTIQERLISLFKIGLKS